VQESGRGLICGIRLEGLRKTSRSPEPRKRSSTLAYSVAMIERIYLLKPIINMQNQIFMRPQLQLSTVGRHGSAGIMTRLRGGQARNRGSIPVNDRICISSPRRPERLWRSPTLLLNPLNAELNPICYLLALLGAHHFLHVSRIRVKLLILRLLMSYIYGAPILDVSRSHTTTQHSR